MARILVADDDFQSRELIAAVLQADGHQVQCVDNGQEALEAVNAHVPDMAFLDVLMPVFDGYETCRRMRADPAIPADLPIIFLTALDQDARKLEGAGGTAFLSKSHVVADLRDLLAKYLGGGA